MAAILWFGDMIANTRIAHKGWKGQKPDSEDTGQAENIPISQTEIQANIRKETGARKETWPELDDRLQRI